VSGVLGLVIVAVVLVPYIVLLGTQGRLPRWPGLPRRWSLWARAAVVEEEQELYPAIHPRRGQPRDAAFAVGALCLVVGASVVMERAGSAVGRHYLVPDIVVGGILLAVVTSLPNAVAAVYLASRGRGAAALSTALNSNTFNVVAGLLVPAVTLGLGRPQAQGTLVAAWYVGLTACTLALAYAGRGLSRVSGSIVIAGYLAFVVVLLAT
jgi:Ca2+/Na+ antiporter